jgi:transcriptional regulator GlxA family with amidase domain
MLALVALFEGFDDLDVFAPVEVLVNAAQGGAPIEVRLASLASLEPVHSSHGVLVAPHRLLEDEPLPDLIVVPGGGWNDRALQGAWGEAQRGELPAVIRRQHRRGATIASVCTGAGIVAAAGLFEGRPVSTHRSAQADLVAMGLEVRTERVVDDGDVLSAGGVTSGLDLALHLVAREFGQSLSDQIAWEIEYERQGTVAFGPHADGAASL